MRCLTVQQPWAWAIIHGGKSVENRTALWSYRGELAIHAGQRWSTRGGTSPLILDAYGTNGQPLIPSGRVFRAGYVIGVVDLVDVHPQHDGCCDNPWAEESYRDADGRVRREITHLVLERPQALSRVLQARGALGLWKPDTDLRDAIDRVRRSGAAR